MDKFYKPSPNKVKKNNPQYYTTVVHTNKKVSPLKGGKSHKIGGIWTIKHEIISPKLYEILINKYLKRDTSLDLKNFYNHIKMCLNAVKNVESILSLLTRKSKVTPLFMKNIYQTFLTLTTLRMIRRTLPWVAHFWRVLTNDICIKSSISSQS